LDRGSSLAFHADATGSITSWYGELRDSI
jgi:hypothetical protein